jgi:ring-1,2-phenylacetyl-CoA epoxidase subunit PaaD
MAEPDAATLADITSLVGAIADPEIPVVTLRDLGILRSVSLRDGRPYVELTPTYSGCPATEAIRQDVIRAVQDAGYRAPEVVMTLSPAWTTDWITDEGRRKLKAYGIAPPGTGADPMQPIPARPIRLHPRSPAPGPMCPRCDSPEVEELSAFGSTACKALYRCRSCAEPFDYFKPY